MCIKKFIGRTCDKMADVPLIGPLVKPKPKIAVIRLAGVIADGTMRRQTINHHKYQKTVEQAFELYNLQAVAFSINSPGGSPAQSALIGNQIRRLAEDKDIPVYAFIEDVAASGGYWLACAADEIYAQDVSIVGSIGVISASFGFQDLIDRHGVERRIHTSGKDKSFLDPFVTEKPGDVKRLKTIQADLHDSFITWVQDRRGSALQGEEKDLFEGQFWTGQIALEHGLIDGLGDLKTVCKEKHGEDIKFIDLTPERGFLSGLMGGDASLSEDALEALQKWAIWARYGL